MKLAYPAIIKTKGRSHVVTLPDFPGISARARNRRAAIDAARVALVAALQDCAKEHEDMPRPSAGRIADLIDLPLLVAAKVALYQTMRDQNLTNVALAERLSTVEGTVRRLIDLHHRSHIEHVETALRLLGKRLIVDLHVGG